MLELLREIRGLRSHVNAAMKANARAANTAAKRLETAYKMYSSSSKDTEDDSSDDDAVQLMAIPPKRKLRTTLQAARRTQVSGGVGSTDAAPAPAPQTETPMQKLRRAEWSKEDRRKHWFLSGAMPVSHKGNVLQARVGLVKLSKSVLHWLTHLADFKVMDFEPDQRRASPPRQHSRSRIA